MAIHNHRKVWTEEEKKVYYEHGLMYCAVHGYEKFKKTGKNYLFSLFLTGSLFIFDKCDGQYFHKMSRHKFKPWRDCCSLFSKINIRLFIYLFLLFF